MYVIGQKGSSLRLLGGEDGGGCLWEPANMLIYRYPVILGRRRGPRPESPWNRNGQTKSMPKQLYIATYIGTLLLLYIYYYYLLILRGPTMGEYFRC